jgi:hypothetical protein
VSDNYKNAMEELARASLTIPDLTKGFVGRVELDISDFDSSEELVAEIHEGQVAMRLAGYRRCPAAERIMPYHQHNIECGAWFKDDHEKKQTDWIRCTISTRFGILATFWNTIDPGERMIGPEELLYLAENSGEQQNPRYESATEGDDTCST